MRKANLRTKREKKKEINNSSRAASVWTIVIHVDMRNTLLSRKHCYCVITYSELHLFLLTYFV